MSLFPWVEIDGMRVGRVDVCFGGNQNKMKYFDA